MIRIVETEPSPHACTTCPAPRTERPQRLFAVEFGQANTNRTINIELCGECLKDWSDRFNKMREICGL